MKKYIVLYRTKNLPPLDAPFGFECQAENTDHAEEQCENAYPGCIIVHVSLKDTYNKALDEYWSDDDEI